MGKLENPIQSAILSFLAYRPNSWVIPLSAKKKERPKRELILNQLADAPTGIVWWRSNSGAHKTGRSFVRYGCSGQPDIMGLHKPTGMLLGIEVKAGAGSLEPSQEFWQSMAGFVGVPYVVARSVDDVSTWLARLDTNLDKITQLRHEVDPWTTTKQTPK